MTRSRTLVISLACVLAGGSCASGGDPRGSGYAGREVRRELLASNEEIALGAERAFQSLGIPVATVDRRTGAVRSGGFQVSGLWAGEPVTARLYCGRGEDGTPPAAAREIELELTVTTSSSNGNRRWVIVRLNAAPAAVERGMEIDGGMRCQFTERFARALLDGIEARAFAP